MAAAPSYIYSIYFRRCLLSISSRDSLPGEQAHTCPRPKCSTHCVGSPLPGLPAAVAEFPVFPRFGNGPQEKNGKEEGAGAVA